MDIRYPNNTFRPGTTDQNQQEKNGDNGFPNRQGGCQLRMKARMDNREEAGFRAGGGGDGVKEALETFARRRGREGGQSPSSSRAPANRGGN